MSMPNGNDWLSRLTNVTNRAGGVLEALRGTGQSGGPSTPINDRPLLSNEAKRNMLIGGSIIAFIVVGLIVYKAAK